MEQLIIKTEIPDAQIRKVIDTYLSIQDNSQEEIFTTQEACDYLKITPQTLNKKANLGEVRYYHKKGVRPKLFLKSELIKYLER